MQLSFLFLAGGLEFAMRKSSWPGLLVVTALLVLSSFSWAVMITKYLQLRRAAKATAAFLTRFRTARSPLQPFASGERMEGSPEWAMYHEACRETAGYLAGSPDPHDGLARKLPTLGPLSPGQWETVNLCLQRVMGEQTLVLEHRTPLLATAVSGGPFLGLLGTVWGVMDTFSAIAESSSTASVKDMAPGVAAALVTTVIGLLVAIPAMFGYNHLVSKIRSLIVGMENFATELSAALHRTYVRSESAAKSPVTVLRPGLIAGLAKTAASTGRPADTEAPKAAAAAPSQQHRQQEMAGRETAERYSECSED
jgi:biopolymer transport protein ExbB/TolQ